MFFLLPSASQRNYDHGSGRPHLLPPMSAKNRGCDRDPLRLLIPMFEGSHDNGGDSLPPTLGCRRGVIVVAVTRTIIPLCPYLLNIAPSLLYDFRHLWITPIRLPHQSKSLCKRNHVLQRHKVTIVNEGQPLPPLPPAAAPAAPASAPAAPPVPN